MQLAMEVKRISAEFWLVTLLLDEKSKISNPRQFVVNIEQLAFLELLVKNWQAAEPELPAQEEQK